MSAHKYTRVAPAWINTVKRTPNGVTVQFDQRHPEKRRATIELAWWQVSALRNQLALAGKHQADEMREQADSIESRSGAKGAQS